MLGGAEWLERRRPLDVGRYVETITTRCFICAIRDREPWFDHHVVLERLDAVAFLAKYPAVYGHVLVAPRHHREGVVSDFTEDEYMSLQLAVRRVGEAVESVVECERLYVLSLGSAAGNTHVHWHLVPCPPGLPFERQQVGLLRIEQDGYVDVPAEEMAKLASRLRDALKGDGHTPGS
jgi:diadenosine tetraphosphate (Ap4A) HIT family hydrolase